jgi:hypothetical protein
LNIKLLMLEQFKDMICKDFTSPGLYPTYILQMVSKIAFTSTNPFTAITQLGFAMGTGKTAVEGQGVQGVQVQYPIWHTQTKPHTHTMMSWVPVSIQACLPK